MQSDVMGKLYVDCSPWTALRGLGPFLVPMNERMVVSVTAKFQRLARGKDPTCCIETLARNSGAGFQ